MSAGVAAPAAPAAAPTNAAAPNGAQTPAAPVDGAPVVPAKAVEAYRFKKALKVNGKEEAVDLDEAGLTRELQVGRHSQRQLAAAQKTIESQAQFDRLISSGRIDEALAMKGVDIKALIQANAQKAAQLAEMTPEQQRIAELEDQLAQREQQTEADNQTRAEQAKTARRQQVQAQTKAELFEALDLGGFKLGPNVTKEQRGAALAAAARLQKAAYMANQPKLTPEQLVAGVHRQMISTAAATAAAAAASPEYRAKYGAEMTTLHGSLTAGLEGDALLDFVGSDFLARMVKAQMGKLERRNQPVQSSNGYTQPAPPKPGEAPPAMDLYTLQDRLRRQRGGT